MPHLFVGVEEVLASLVSCKGHIVIEDNILGNT